MHLFTFSLKYVYSKHANLVISGGWGNTSDIWAASLAFWETIKISKNRCKDIHTFSFPTDVDCVALETVLEHSG
jgi:hypothetical protein